MYNNMNKPIKLWCGRIPEIYGYGIMVLECTEEDARKSLKKHFYAFRKSYGNHYMHSYLKTFERAFEYFGGAIVPIESGKMYYDNLGE